MKRPRIIFKELAEELLPNAKTLLQEWLPHGKLNGSEYCCGSLHGESGNSLKINIRTGKWADFATDDKGGDLISLYAAIKKISQIESARYLSIKFGRTSYSRNASAYR